MAGFILDVRSGFKAVRQNLGPNLLIWTVLTVVIAANVAILAVVRSVLLRPLPYRDPGSLVMVWEKPPNPAIKPSLWPVSYPNYLDWKNENKVLEDLAAYHPSRMVWDRGNVSELTVGASVSGNFFTLLGVPPQLGRPLVQKDILTAAPAAVISHRIWANHFGKDPGILGKTVVLDQVPHSVVAVMPETFFVEAILTVDNERRSARTDFWIPLAPAKWQQERLLRYLQTLGRLKPGIDAERAQFQMDILAQQLAAKHPGNSSRVRVVGYREILVGNAAGPLRAAWLAVAFLLAIGCINVVHILLSLNLKRRKELVIRQALGATAPRLARQLLAEVGLVCVLAGVAAVFLIWAGLGSFLPGVPDRLPLKDEIVVDGPVLVFGVAISLLIAGVAAGSSLITLRRFTWNQELFSVACREHSGAPQGSGRGGLMISELALALALLIGAAMMAQSFYRLSSVSPGFQSGHLMSFKVSLPYSVYDEPHRVRDFHQRLLDIIEAVPGVEAVAAISDLPFTTWQFGSIFVQSRPDLGDNPPDAQHTFVSPGYFELLDIPVLEGRTFTQQDDAGAPKSVIINQTLREEIFPGQNPLGERIRFRRKWREVVGVVEDTKQRSLEAPVVPQIYLPFLQAPKNWMTYIYRESHQAPQKLLPMMRRSVAQIDPAVPVSEARPVAELVEGSLSERKFHTVLFALFSSVACFLSVFGVFGTMSSGVERRMHEFGVRLAIGAQWRNIFFEVLRSAGRFTACGAALGLLLAFGLTRLFTSWLYETSPLDPYIYAAGILIMVLTALAASFFPALRASRADPIAALRE
ncbi:MAG: ABC transporter permease [Acidobacteriota bacterium]